MLDSKFYINGILFCGFCVINNLFDSRLDVAAPWPQTELIAETHNQTDTNFMHVFYSLLIIRMHFGDLKVR